MATKQELVTHTGGCHCKRVRWKVSAPANAVCWSCNCSICSIRQSLHFIVPEAQFELEKESEQWLTLYSFGTHKAKHMFCKVCGVCSYFVPRSNPDGCAVEIRCVDPGTVEIAEYRSFDGENWEEAFEHWNIAAITRE